LGALLLIWAIQKFLGKWIESAASAFQEWLINRFEAGHWFRRAALRRYVAALLEDYDKVPVKALIVDQFADHGFARASRFVDRALYDGDLTILFDGLDEVATGGRWSGSG